jgi:hypothetical protein
MKEVDQERRPSQICRRRPRRRLTVLIEFGYSARRQRSSGRAQTSGIVRGQRHITVSKQMRVCTAGQLGKRGLDASCCSSESEDVKGLTKIVTTLIAIGWLQRSQLTDAVGVSEQGVAISVPGAATG